jgi:peptide/nickel transport system substrate-binding protein
MMRSRIRASIAIAAVIASLAAMTGCTSSSNSDKNDTLTVASPAATLSVSYNFLASQASYTDNFPIQATYDTLVMENTKTGAYGPWLATKWTFNSNRTVMTITLPNNAKFRDGTPLTAANAAASFNAVAAVNPPITFIGFDQYGAKFVATGKETLQIRTTRPIDQTFFVLLAYIPVMAPTLVAHPKEAAKTPDGTGPYVLDQKTSKPGVELNFTRNPDYWNLKAFPYKHIVMKAYNDNVSTLNALKTGQVNVGAIDPSAVNEAKSSSLNIATAHGNYYSLFFNDRAGAVVPALKDKRVRQAINLSFDRAAIDKNIDFGLGHASSQAFTQGQPEYIKGKDGAYGYDPAKAKKLLAEAGYPNGFALTLPEQPINSSVQPVIQQSLSNIGITVTWKNFTDADAVKASQMPVFVWNNYYVNTISTYLSPTALWNGSHYSDPTVADLLHTISYGSSSASATASQKLGNYLIDQAWFAPFSSPPTVWASTKGVTVKLGPVTAQRHLQNFLPAT